MLKKEFLIPAAATLAMMFLSALAIYDQTEPVAAPPPGSYVDREWFQNVIRQCEERIMECSVTKPVTKIELSQTLLKIPESGASITHSMFIGCASSKIPDEALELMKKKLAQACPETIVISAGPGSAITIEEDENGSDGR